MTDLVSYIPGVGPTQTNFNAGATTPTQYRGPHTAATDGTNVQNASRNMAEFYNRERVAYISLVQAAGLTHDPANWAQNVAAIQALISAGMSGSGALIVGESRNFNFVSPPSKWLVEDGSAVSRTTYSALFSAIGTTFGAGNGNTTFNLPDSRGNGAIGTGQGPGLTARNLGQRFGEERHVLTVAEMPSHTHDFSQGGVNGAGFAQLQNSSASTQTTQSTGGDQSHNNMPPSIVKLVCIYAGV